MAIIPARLVPKLADLLKLIRDDPSQLRRMARSLALGQWKYRAYFLKPEDWRLDEEAVRKLLTRNLLRYRVVGRQPTWKRSAIEVLVRRSQGTVGHSACTAELNRITESLSVEADSSEAYFAFAKASASVGLFEGSYGFIRLAYARIESDARSSSDVRDALNSVRVALHTQRPQVAAERLAAVDSEIPLHARPGFEMLNIYLSSMESRVALGNSSAEPDGQRWAHDLEAARVLIVGPADSSFDPSGTADYDFIAQIYRNRELQRFPSRAEGHSHEILYVGGLYFQLRQLTQTELAERFGGFRHFVINAKSSSLGLNNTRRADSRISSLFLRGTPNMIQVMCLDMMVAGVASLYVVGANFYAAPEPYAAGDSGGFEKFGFCCAIASHNPTENRALIANLVSTGLINGEDRFLDVLRLSDVDYLRVLDRFYGEPER